jgi:hypothetical protein
MPRFLGRIDPAVVHSRIEEALRPMRATEPER